MTATALAGQSLWDMALQHCGSADAAFAIARMNNVNLTDSPTPGTVLALPAVTNKKVVKYYADNGIMPASGASTSSATGDGIGYWVIGANFEVQ